MRVDLAHARSGGISRRRRPVASRPGLGLPRERSTIPVKFDANDMTAHRYCQQARRLRQHHASNPALLQRRLSELARSHDTASRQTAPRTSALSNTLPRLMLDTETIRRSAHAPATPFARAVVDWFAQHVAAQLEGRLIHYSQRRALLKTAERLGIGRFHANLLIAVAQHDKGCKPPLSTEERDRGPTPGLPRIAIALLLLIVQSLIVYGAWRIAFSPS